MNVELQLKLIYAIFGFLIAAIPLVSSLIVSIKQKCKAKKALATSTNEAEKADAVAKDAVATAELRECANKLIAEAEKLYNDVDAELKKHGKTAGLVKKDSVMSKLQLKALELNTAFDVETWSKYIDKIVAMTKIVNAK